GSHPIELDDAPLTDEGLVSMPRIICPLESEQGSLDRRYLDDDVVEVLSRPQKTQTPAGILPRCIHVNKHRDDLARGIGMDFSVSCSAPAAHRRGGRPAGQIKRELLLECLAKR